MTAGELRRRLAREPDHLPVAVCLDGEISCRDGTGDRVQATAEGFFTVEDTERATQFQLGQGFCPIVLLKAVEDT